MKMLNKLLLILLAVACTMGQDAMAQSLLKLESGVIRPVNPAWKMAPGALTALHLDQNVQTLSGTKTLIATDLPIQKLDPNGSDRDVNLPAEASSTDLVFFIFNQANGAGEDLVIKDDTPTTLATIGPENVAMCSCDGTTWTVRIWLPPDVIQADGVGGGVAMGTTNLFGGIYKTVTNPNDADLLLIGRNSLSSAITPRKIWGIAVGGTSVVVQIQECDTTGANCAAIHDALTVDTDGAFTTTFTDSSIAAGAVLKLDIGTVTGAVTQLMVGVE